MDRAVSEAWAVAQGLLVRFAHALLALPESSDAEDLEDDQARVVAASGLSLLPHRSGPPSASGHRGYRTYAWAFERGSAYQDSFEALVAHVTALSPSIYNLEVVYAPLQQFIGNSGRLLHAWQQPDDVASVLSGPGVEAEYAILPAFVSKAVDVFVKAARNDVRAYMGNAFGNRAGTLLQPPSLGKIREHTQVAGAASRYALPAMSQTQVLLDVIGNCLSLCIAVPTVARRLGEVVNSDVIKPFSERAIYALNLAESWTDAGPLLKEIRTAAHPTEESQKLDAHGASSSSRRNGLRRSQTWNAKALRTIRRRPDLTTTCLSRMYDKSNHLAREKPVRLLDESEWNAVVRLVVNAKVVIAELENCTNTEEEWKPTGVTSHSSSFSQESVSILKLRAALCDHGASASHQRAVIEAVGRMRSGCRILREEVVERGIAVLHTEVVLRCFWEAMQTLTINKKVKKTGLSRSAIPANDAIPHVNGTGISKVAPIFKTSNFQLSDAERSSEDTSVAMCEYDEFGDRIANENVTDVDIEDYSFPSTAVFEATEWKAPPRDSSIRSTTDDVMLSAAQTQALTDTDRRIVARGRAFGEELRSKDEVIKCNLSVRERRFIFCEADGGVAAGIRVAGELAGKGDRDVASGARLFLDAAATTGAVAFGWPVVESDYSVAEGASASGSECRTLLYAAGLM
ncbi:unnamed protein product [Chondrus crispus]|uniref:Uncharacterized protein n=1 Tax=Chondrus crispus TaxID=2769 RepID=R7QJR8_CHOCR|nr:unnamed protein product [Chondrus crispus]CDF38767.1 unnamed protein product [Chondrus crispus]|eukprot:XP_005718672.1 unnamed protein product [Chondrus crispus]